MMIPRPSAQRLIPLQCRGRIRPVKLTFAQVKVFVDDWRHLRLTDEDLRELELQLMTGPASVGRVMAGTGGLRKVRFSPPS